MAAISSALISVRLGAEIAVQEGDEPFPVLSSLHLIVEDDDVV